jgi:hypothetical protein
MRKVIAAAALVLFTSHAMAQFTGMELLNMCTTEAEGQDVVCMGYLLGLNDAMNFNNAKLEAPQRIYCVPPESVTSWQIQLVVIKYLEDHPEKLHEEAVVGVMDALTKAFPCEN